MDGLEVADAGDFGLVLGHAAADAQFLDFLLAADGDVVGYCFCFGGGFLHVDEIDIGVIFGLGCAVEVFGGYDGQTWVAVLFAAGLGGSP